MLVYPDVEQQYDKIRDIGNFSAHGITYIASEKDINDIKLKYRVAIEEIFDKAGRTQNAADSFGKNIKL